MQIKRTCSTNPPKRNADKTDVQQTRHRKKNGTNIVEDTSLNFLLILHVFKKS